MIGQTISHYRILEKLGEGGMGVVYRARDIKLDRDVALKVLPSSGVGERARQRFLLEARAASALSHPGIVTIFEASSDEDVDFIAMEYVQGSTMRDLAGQRGLSSSQVLDYAIQMTGALANAHKAGIVHRDLKPGNVMVTDEGLVKILDFGLAKRIALHAPLDEDVTKTAPLTLEGSVLGTVGYLSPEQARGEPVDGRSDIFSLSAMLYELLSGVRPFAGNSALAVLHSLANDEPRPLSSIRPEAPHALDCILQRGLAKRREDRYVSMEELAADLRLAMAGQPVESARLLDETRTLEAPAGGGIVRVPNYRNAFLGRESELAELARFFAEPRIVTLVAGGGTGKTRLAYEAAVAMSDRFPHGVFAIELADGGPGDVAIRAAEAVLGEAPLARTEGLKDPAGAVEAYLERRRALLVIDNCEHVVGAVREMVSRLSRHCSKLSILNTSREVLGVDGEQVIALSTLGPSPAVALFRERASAASGDFGSDPEQSAAIEEICMRLEGLPLAIELAASRVRTLRPVQIAARLDDALKLLRQRSAGDTDRHRSLEATIRWSYDLLSEAERALLARMAVFVGGFDLAAAEGVGGDVLDLVESLVDKSLVTADTTGETVRYRLAEPIRQFAAERLMEMGQVQAARQAHFDHYFQVAQASGPRLDEAPHASLVAGLSREHENFLAAIERARTGGDLRAASKLALVLRAYWSETGHLAVGSAVHLSILQSNPADPAMLPHTAMLVAFESMCGALQQADRRAGALRALLAAPIPEAASGRVRFALGFVEDAAGRSANSLEFWSKSGEQLLGTDPSGARQSFWCAGHAATVAGEFEQARRLYIRAEEIPPPVQAWFPPALKLSRGVIEALSGARDLTPVQEGLEQLERLGLRFRMLLAAAAGSLAFFYAGDVVAAEKWWRRGLDLGREMGHLWACWTTLEFAAWSAAVRGDDLAAARLWGAVDAFAETRGYGHWEVVRQERAGRMEKVRARDPDAYLRAASEGARVPLSRIVDEALKPREVGTPA